MSKTFYNAQNLIIGNGFVRNPNRYYLEEYFDSLPYVELKKFTSLTGDDLKTVTNTTNETTMATVTIPANSLSIGDVIHIVGYAKVTGSNSTDTSLITLKIGTIALLTQASAIDAVNDDIALVDFYLTITAKGSSGTFVGHGELRTDGNGDTLRIQDYNDSTTINFTVDQNITFNNTWSVANAGNIITSQSFFVEIKSNQVTNKNFVIQGTNINNDKVVFGASSSTDTDKTGIKISSEASSTYIIAPNTIKDKSPWNSIKWGTDSQLEWECALSVELLTSVKVWTGFKLTNTNEIITDDNQVFFRYDSSDTVGCWQIVISISGVDFVSKTPVTVVANTIYKFRISIDSSRFARVFINDVQYNVTTSEGSTGSIVSAGVIPSAQLTATTDLKPFIGIKNDSSAENDLCVYYQKISRVLD